MWMRQSVCLRGPPAGHRWLGSSFLENNQVHPRTGPGPRWQPALGAVGQPVQQYFYWVAPSLGPLGQPTTPGPTMKSHNLRPHQPPSPLRSRPRRSSHGTDCPRLVLPGSPEAHSILKRSKMEVRGDKGSKDKTHHLPWLMLTLTV